MTAGLAREPRTQNQEPPDVILRSAVRRQADTATKNLGVPSRVRRCVESPCGPAQDRLRSDMPFGGARRSWSLRMAGVAFYGAAEGHNGCA